MSKIIILAANMLPLDSQKKKREVLLPIDGFKVDRGDLRDEVC